MILKGNYKKHGLKLLYHQKRWQPNFTILKPGTSDWEPYVLAELLTNLLREAVIKKTGQISELCQNG